MNRTITSVQLTAGNGAVIHYAEQRDDAVAEIVYDSEQMVHPDMLQAFDELRPLVAWLLGFIEAICDWVPEDADKHPILKVYGLSIGPGGFVVFKANVVSGPYPYNVTTPKYKLDEDDIPLVQAVRNEALSYLDGKGAELSLFGDKTADDIIAEAELEGE